MNVDEEDVQRALSAADAGNAYHWPTVAAVLAARVRELEGQLATQKRITERALAANVEQRARDAAGATTASPATQS